MSETNSAPGNEPENQSTHPTAGRFWLIMVIVAVLGFGAYAVKTIIDDHNRNKNTTVAESDLNRDDIAEEFKPEDNQNPPSDQPASTNEVPKTTDQNLRGPAVLGTETHTEPSPAQPQFKPYRNDSLGFETIVPFDANVIKKNNETTAVSPPQGGIYWTATVYSNTSETLTSIEDQLRNSPSVTSLFRTTVGGITALRFTSPNLNGGTGYAFINNTRLYYLVGDFSDPTLLTSFKFF